MSVESSSLSGVLHHRPSRLERNPSSTFSRAGKALAAGFFSVLRGTVVNGTYGIHKNLPGMYLPIFTINNNIWCYVLWSPVLVHGGPIPLITMAFRGGRLFEMVGQTRRLIVYFISSGCPTIQQKGLPPEAVAI